MEGAALDLLHHGSPERHVDSGNLSRGSLVVRSMLALCSREMTISLIGYVVFARGD